MAAILPGRLTLLVMGAREGKGCRDPGVLSGNSLVSTMGFLLSPQLVGLLSVAHDTSLSSSNVFVSPNLSERLSLPHSLSPVLRLRTPSNAPGANEAPRGLRGNSVLPSPPLTDCHPGQDNSEDAQGSGSLRDCC